MFIVVDVPRHEMYLMKHTYVINNVSLNEKLQLLSDKRNKTWDMLWQNNPRRGEKSNSASRQAKTLQTVGDYFAVTLCSIMSYSFLSF